MTTQNATNTYIVSPTTYELTRPLQPTFFALNSASDPNITGDGSTYDIICDTEIYDYNSDYNNATGVFTCSLDSKFEYITHVALDDLTGHTGYVELETSNQIFQTWNIGWATALTVALSGGYTSSIICEMDAADTVFMSTTMSGGAKNVDVIGNITTAVTYFGGSMIC